ncbi:MAG: ankyrin repeat domain-containing protein [Thermoguttaceae bacterium]|nr:ankyrin repeat domain-containing protein [Thermoguttaceae bacterium]
MVDDSGLPRRAVELHHAVRRNNPEHIAELLSRGEPLDVRDEAGRTPLHIAAVKNHSAVIRLLIEAGADPNLFDDSGLTPLHAAIVRRRRGAAEQLLADGADVRPARDSAGETPRRGPRIDPNLPTAAGDTPLRLSVLYDMWDLIPSLACAGARLDRSVGCGVLPSAADGGGEELREYFIEYGIDVRRESIEIPLVHAAARAGKLETLRFLESEGADFEARDPDGKTPLHIAYEQRRAECAAFLLERGARFETADLFGETLLHKAVRFGDLPAVRDLLRRGADPNRADADGKTALHKAAECGRRALIPLLLESGADPGKADSAGRTYTDYLRSWD